MLTIADIRHFFAMESDSQRIQVNSYVSTSPLYSIFLLILNYHQINQFISKSAAEDNDDLVDYTNLDDNAAEELETYNVSVHNTLEERDILAALEGQSGTDCNEAHLQRQREVLAWCILEEEKGAKAVEERRLKEVSRETQRRLALAESVPLLPSNAPQPFDNIKKKSQCIAHTPDPSSSGLPPAGPSSLQPPTSLHLSSSSGYLPHNNSKRKQHSSPPCLLPLLTVYQKQ